VQGQRSESCQELMEGQVAAPLEAAWDSIRTGLRRDLGVRTFDGWLKPAGLGDFDPESGSLDIVMPSQFMADWVRSHFGDRLALAWKTTLPLVREVRIIANADGPRPTPLLILEEPPEPAQRARDPSAPNFDPRYRFETFVIGKANEVAATAAKTLATAKNVSFNPLYSRRHRSRQDSLAACHRSRLPRPEPLRARRFDVGGKVHGRVHPCAEGKRHDRVQEPAA
jgi:chromosomal replication initiator protein